MGIEDDFYATIKLKTGEEIFARVSASEEEDRTLLIVSNPVVVSEVVARGTPIGYKIEPWLKTTKEDLFIINLNDVLTLAESSDIEMIMMHESYTRKLSKDISDSKSKLSREMGYISSVKEAKKLLEKLYKSS
jgi:hypothetical protein